MTSESIFTALFNRSINAGWIIIAVIALRLIYRRAPRKLLCLMWILPAMRLLLPFFITSRLSILPRTETVGHLPLPYSQQWYVRSGISTIDELGSGLLNASPSGSAVTVAATVWKFGVAAMLAYAAISYLCLILKTRASVRIAGNVFKCDYIDSPFILGMISPKIYLPSGIDNETAECVLMHERAHISRLDNILKPCGFLLLSVYWFNPLMWAAYVLFCRDIEYACDEKVISGSGSDKKKAYSSALLVCGAKKHPLSVCPLAFGEVRIKERIKNVLNYKKPAMWITLAAIAACIVTAAMLLTDPLMFRAPLECRFPENSEMIDFDSETEQKILAIMNNGRWEHTVYDLAVKRENEYIFSTREYDNIRYDTQSGYFEIRGRNRSRFLSESERQKLNGIIFSSRIKNRIP